MSQFTFKMPDLGEGTVDAEIVAWHTKPGDLVAEDQLIVEVMTDKAAVEVPAPVSGRVVSVTGAPGDKVAVGSPLIVFELSDGAAVPAAVAVAAAAPAPPKAVSDPAPTVAQTVAPPAPTVAQPVARPAASPAAAKGRVMTSPANRRLAREAGIDLATVAGSGPGGRILRADLQTGAPRETSADATDAADTTEIKVIGLRRLIAERMSEAKRTIPHFAYVEEVDVTELESLREHLNHARPKDAGSLSYLPLVVMALTRVLESFPQCNVLYDAARGVLVRHRAMHVGIATQTSDGLKVPVVRNAQSTALMGADGKLAQFATADIKEERGSPVSLMPQGLYSSLSVQEFTDLIDYLTSLKQPENSLTSKSLKRHATSDRPEHCSCGPRDEGCDHGYLGVEGFEATKLM